jgi:hypothetical protein
MKESREGRGELFVGGERGIEERRINSRTAKKIGK